MSAPRSTLVVASLLALPLLAGASEPRTDTPGPKLPAPKPGPVIPAEPASYYTGRLIGSPGSQDPETDLGIITSIRYHANQTNNQSIAISAQKAGKTNVCVLQFNPTVMAKTFAAVTRAEAIETYREIVAAARTPHGQVLCMAAPTKGPGSIDRVMFTGSLYWVVLANGGDTGFQIIAQ